VLLTGGSAFGLDAAGGVMRWLDEHGHGLAVGPARVPIVPAAVLFDLWVGDPRVRPDAQAGYAACVAASAEPPRRAASVPAPAPRWASCSASSAPWPAASAGVGALGRRDGRCAGGGQCHRAT
jgi:hypothetical protein